MSVSTVIVALVLFAYCAWAILKMLRERRHKKSCLKGCCGCSGKKGSCG